MTNWNCEMCSKPKLPDPKALKIGDEVNFTVKSIGRNTASFQSKTGEIIDFDGDEAFIETKAGRVVRRPRESLTPSDAPSPLTYIFGYCQCDQGKENGSE